VLLRNALQLNSSASLRKHRADKSAAISAASARVAANGNEVVVIPDALSLTRNCARVDRLHPQIGSAPII
jgi:hypothetical protein